MKKHLFLWILFIMAFSMFSQENNIIETKIKTQPKKKPKDIPLDSIKNLYGARYVDYKIITYHQDTVQIDTTLTIQKYFTHNFTHKDNFEWLAFANLGQTFNKLGYNFVNDQITPKIGITAKQYDYYKVQDVNYYHVPTPTTILDYRSGFTGQYLNSLFTTNFGRHNNFAINYQGLKSFGKYQRARAKHGTFILSYSYFNPAKRYQFRTHIFSQTSSNLENGGMKDKSIIEFRNNNPDFTSRNRIDINLSGSESILKSRRYYYEHELRIINSKDSLNQHLTNLKLGHHISYESSRYNFTSTDTLYFGKNPNIFGKRIDSITETKINDKIIKNHNNKTNDKTHFSKMENQIYLKFNSPWILGNFKAFINSRNLNQIYDSITKAGKKTIPKEKKVSYTSMGATWNGSIKGIFLNGYVEQIISGGNLGSNLHISAGFKLKNNTLARAGIQLKTAAPNMNTMFYQSNFSNFNWNQNFENIVYRTLYGNIKTKWINADAYIHQIKNYTYFNSNSVASQYSGNINYLKIKVNNEFKFGRFRLNNTMMYQKLAQGNAVFRVPEFVTRNALYYEGYFFKGKPLLAQIGISFKYFSKYYANSFNPVLNEFYIQNNTQIGDYPTFNLFFNGEVRRTRVFIKVENVTAAFTGRNYFVTPNTAARDFAIRFGLTWNFWN